MLPHLLDVLMLARLRPAAELGNTGVPRFPSTGVRRFNADVELLGGAGVDAVGG